jgi:hypothetical protein
MCIVLSFEYVVKEIDSLLFYYNIVSTSLDHLYEILHAALILLRETANEAAYLI